MPAAARKSADAAPVEEPGAVPAEAAVSEAPVAEETPAAADAAPVEEPRLPVRVVFNGQAQSAVAGIGLCEPDEAYLVAAVFADELCRTPLFTRAAE